MKYNIKFPPEILEEDYEYYSLYTLSENQYDAMCEDAYEDYVLAEDPRFVNEVESKEYELMLNTGGFILVKGHLVVSDTPTLPLRINVSNRFKMNKEVTESLLRGDITVKAVRYERCGMDFVISNRFGFDFDVIESHSIIIKLVPRELP